MTSLKWGETLTLVSKPILSQNYRRSNPTAGREVGCLSLQVNVANHSWELASISEDQRILATSTNTPRWQWKTSMTHLWRSNKISRMVCEISDNPWRQIAANKFLSSAPLIIRLFQLFLRFSVRCQIRLLEQLRLRNRSPKWFRKIKMSQRWSSRKKILMRGLDPFKKENRWKKRIAEEPCIPREVPNSRLVLPKFRMISQVLSRWLSKIRGRVIIAAFPSRRVNRPTKVIQSVNSAKHNSKIKRRRRWTCWRRKCRNS